MTLKHSRLEELADTLDGEELVTALTNFTFTANNPRPHASFPKWHADVTQRGVATDSVDHLMSLASKGRISGDVYVKWLLAVRAKTR